MYEHPIKRAGLSLNRIIYSNTMMVGPGFPTYDSQKFNLGFKYRTFDAGKVISSKCKFTVQLFRVHVQRSRRSPASQKCLTLFKYSID